MGFWACRTRKVCPLRSDNKISEKCAPVAYFFCSSETKTQREPLAIIRSWIWQAIDCNENALEQALAIRAKEMRLATRTDSCLD